MLLHYVLNMQNIYEQSLEGIIINTKLLSIFNGALMIEMISNSFYESKNYFVLIKSESFNEKRHIHYEKHEF